MIQIEKQEYSSHVAFNEKQMVDKNTEQNGLVRVGLPRLLYTIRYLETDDKVSSVVVLWNKTRSIQIPAAILSCTTRILHPTS